MKPYMLVFVCTACPRSWGASSALAQSDKSGVGVLMFSMRTGMRPALVAGRRHGDRCF